MVARWVEVLTGPLDQQKQYRQAKARLAALPEPYRTTASAVSRYLIHCSGITDGETIVAMVTGLADLWERAALDGTPVRDRKSTRLNSSHVAISYAVFCLKKKNRRHTTNRYDPHHH